MDFIENKPVHPRSRGSVEVICGSMFSGKTEELIRRLRRANIAKQKVELFKPVLDKRYSDTEVTSHDARMLSAMAVETASQILLWVGDDVDVVGIDEAQFFDNALVGVCNALANNGVRVIVAGLDMDYLGKPFGPVPELMAIAEFVSKVHAICIHCGNPAQFSYRKVTEDQLVMLGLQDSYEPLCRSCFGEVTGKSGVKEP